MLKVTVDSNPEAKVSASSVTKAAGGGGSGGFYIPSVSQPDANTMRVTYLQSDSSMPSVDSKDVTLPAGPAGPRGYTGDTGHAGPAGQDGVGIQSVEQTTTSTEDGGMNVITVTTTDGTTSTFEVRNGSKGSTPQKGTDYWTQDDQQSIVADVLAYLPTWEGGSY